MCPMDIREGEAEPPPRINRLLENLTVPKPNPKTGGWILTAAVALLISAGINRPTTAIAEPDTAAVARLTSIIIDEGDSERARSAAEVLQTKLKERHDIDLEIELWVDIERGQASDQNCIFVGRTAAIKAGMIAEDELAEVKHDGYVIRSADGRIALAGYNGRGTMYAAYRLLEHLGLKIYGDGNRGTFAEVRSDPKPIDDMNIVDKPAFDYRSAAGPWFSKSSVGDVGTTDGRGATVLNPELFTPGRDTAIDGWQSGQHSATYLVPPALHYDEHPEYFALRQGKRISDDTRLIRFNLCLSNPDVG
ncbi:MAG: DUF4838 domain-containing protein, partial [Phycisphaeraceae bacterium]